MLRIISFFILSIVFLSAKEISVLGAGDIDSSSPYGLTKTEKAILKNSKKIKSFSNKIHSIELSQEEIIEKLEGISSVYESDSKSLYKTKRSITSIHNNIEANKINISNINSHIDKNTNNIKILEEKIDTFILVQKKNNILVEKSLEDITKLINSINMNYVSKKEFDELVSFVNKTKRTYKKVVTKKTTVKRTNKETLKVAIKLYNKNYLTKSKPLFENLVRKKYKPAQSNYYLGEIYFYKKKYKDAIHHFKTSMMLYDEASYIPKLLLHSAISFEKTNDKDNAINFYGTLVDAYPETKEAKIAQKNLQKL